MLGKSRVFVSYADPAASVEDALAIVADLDEPNAGVDMTIDRRKSMRAVKA